MRPPCGSCGTYRPLEMSNVIPGLCGYCAIDRIVKVTFQPRPFGDGTIEYWVLVGMVQQGTKELKRVEKSWSIR